MSHSIPVFLIPISLKEVPSTVEHWNDAEGLINQRYTNKDKFPLYSITSRNWWVQHAISLICRDLGITGLDFILSEIVVISEEELRGINHSFTKLIEKINTGIPKLSSNSEKEGSIWGLRYEIKNGKEVLFTKNEISNAFLQSNIMHQIYVSDSGYQSVVDFFSSVKIYHKVIEYCIKNNECLLIVQPQP